MKSEQEIDTEKAAKPRPDLIPAIAEHECGRALGEGYRKHGTCTWKNAGTKQALASTHYASLRRHLNAWARGENVDPESGDARLLHLGCAMAQIAIMLDIEHRGREPAPASAPSKWPLPRGWYWIEHGGEYEARYHDDPDWYATSRAARASEGADREDLIALVRARNEGSQ